MSESTDPALSTVCAHCGKRFHRRRFVNRYTTYASVEVLGKPAPAKYCSPACRQDAYRKRTQRGTQADRSPVTDLADPIPQVGASHASTPSRQDDADAFERIRSGRQLSRWEPCANPDPHASGFEIPNFLQQTA